MRVKRLYDVNHDGKLYGPGDELEIVDEIGASWVKSGAAVKVEKADAKKKAKADAKKQAEG